jgi:4'-phosphopantetheinyl transferase
MTALSDIGAQPGARWAPGPASPRLATGEAHIWRADLRQVGEADLRWLSRAERRRAGRFPTAEKGWLWGRSRGVLRRLLSAYLETDPAAIQIQPDLHGKPRLAGRDPARDICFNTSHSGPTALYAFVALGDVGIDVEVARRPIDEVAVAARAFGSVEAARLGKLQRRDRAIAFRRAWVRAEAAAKCLGTGLALSAAAEQRRPVVRSIPTQAPWIIELYLGKDSAAALAAEPAPRAVRCWDWAP